MKQLFRWWMLVVAAALLAVGALAWWFLGRGGKEPPTANGDAPPVAQVNTALLRHGEIERTFTAYGTAVAAPGATRSLSFPFECRVVAVGANVGQPVKAGDVLLQIEPSTDARLTLDTAKSVRDAADAALKDVQGRFRAHLATNADLATAQSAAREAGLKLQSLQSRLPGAEGDVLAPAAGLVISIAARPGAVVPAGGPLVELAVDNRLEARLGIAPRDSRQVRAGQPVHLTPVESREGASVAPMTGTVRVVGQSVDAGTRLVDGFVAFDNAPATGAPVLIGTYLRAEIVVEKKQVLLAPRAAVLPDETHPGRAVLFTVAGNKAVKHEVGTGIEDGTSVEITDGSNTLADGTKVVTQGTYELEDGMAVEIGPTTDPTTVANPDGEGKTP